MVTKTEQALKMFPETRDNDLLLMLKVWDREGFNLSDRQKEKFLSGLTKPESIRRTRQKLQQQGLYPANQEVDDARFDKFVEMKNNMRIEDIL